MSVKITVLFENTVHVPGLLGEHGFAALLVTPDASMLFDTGQGFSLVQNALRFQKDLRKVSQVVLSHGHFDHTGGLLAFLGVHGQCPIMAHPDVLAERFRWMPVGPEEKPVSMDPKPEGSKPVPADLVVQMHNLRSRYKPFIVFEPGNSMRYLRDMNLANLARPGSGNHWPVGQILSDGAPAWPLTAPPTSWVSRSPIRRTTAAWTGATTAPRSTA